MRAYIIRRLILVIPTMVLVTLIIFFMIQLVPGSVIDLMLSEMEYRYAERDIEEMKAALGIDVPVHVQYVRWVGGVAQGDLGVSLWTGRPVMDELIVRLPVSIELGTLAIITALLIALPIGVYSAVRQDTGGDYIGRTIAVLCISLPSFWVGTMVIVYPSIWWGWSPSLEYIPLTENLAGNLVQFILPAIILGMMMSGTTMRMTRTMMLEVLRQDYIRTAWAKGLKERTVVMRHALKNALIPVVSIIGLLFAVLVGGSVVIEQIFSLPGIGRLLVEAIHRRDYIIISGINVFVAVLVLMVNLAVDVSYAYLDPRVQYK